MLKKEKGKVNDNREGFGIRLANPSHKSMFEEEKRGKNSLKE